PARRRRLCHRRKPITRLGRRHRRTLHHLPPRRRQNHGHPRPIPWPHVQKPPHVHPHPRRSLHGPSPRRLATHPHPHVRPLRPPQHDPHSYHRRRPHHRLPPPIAYYP